MNKQIKIQDIEILSDQWYTLKKVTFQRQNADGEWQLQHREAYDRGNGAVILLYSRDRKVVLTRQFRMPTYLNGNETGMMIEACAGLLEPGDADPAERVKKEAEEETGYKVTNVQKIFEAYMSPGSVTEILHFYLAEYTHHMKVSEGGGLESEQEHIEVLELDFDEAYNMIGEGTIRDAKTIMLLQYIKLNKLI